MAVITVIPQVVVPFLGADGFLQPQLRHQYLADVNVELLVTWRRFYLRRHRHQKRSLIVLDGVLALMPANHQEKGVATAELVPFYYPLTLLFFSALNLSSA